MIDQFWWGHRARKRTRLYIVGRAPRDLPKIPLALGDAPMLCGTSGRRLKGDRNRARAEIPKPEREHTPIDFARWLVELARGVGAAAVREAA